MPQQQTTIYKHFLTESLSLWVEGNDKIRQNIKNGWTLWHQINRRILTHATIRLESNYEPCKPWNNKYNLLINNTGIILIHVYSTTCCMNIQQVRYINLNPGRLFIQQPPKKGDNREKHCKIQQAATMMVATAALPQSTDHSVIYVSLFPLCTSV